MKGNSTFVGLKLQNSNGVYIKGAKEGDLRFYKDPDAFESGEGICYIPESQLYALENLFQKHDRFLTEDFILANGIGYTRGMIYELLEDAADAQMEISPFELTDYITFLSTLGLEVFDCLCGADAKHFIRLMNIYAEYNRK